MINYQTILSNYNKRGTLLKWLRTLQTALEEGALETVTTTTTDDSVVFHFGFADGTSVDSPPIQLEAGPQGPEGPEGPEGPQGPAATISIGSVTTLPAGSSATVVNSGTSGAAVFDFGIPEGDTGPQGEDGPQGPAATVAIGTVTTLSPGSNATVTNSGTSSAAVFDFGIPQGANGDPGEVIEQIVPVETTTTASRPYAKDAYFVNSSGILVQATAAIALGDTIDSTNSTAVNATLADEIPTLEMSTGTPNGVNLDTANSVLQIFKYGHLVLLTGYFTPATNLTAAKLLFSGVPAQLAGTRMDLFYVSSDGSPICGRGFYQNNGIYTNGTFQSGKIYGINTVYVI